MKRLYIRLVQHHMDGSQQSLSFDIGEGCMLKHLDEIEKLLTTMAGAAYRYECNAERTHEFVPCHMNDGCDRCGKPRVNSVHG